MSKLAAHYEAVRERNGYERPGGDVGPFSDPALRRRFVAADDPKVVAASLDRPTLVCMGAGMTGPPHLGTVGQLLTAIELQAAGLDVQFVLADLEPYHDGGYAAELRQLTERYRRFALELGFDSEQGILRTQSEARDVMATGHRLARYYEPDAWEDAGSSPGTDWADAVADLYDRMDSGTEGNDGPTSDAASAHSAVLHGADFLHPLREGGYEQALLCFGIDEHHLTPWTRQFRDAAGISGRVGGIYTRMVPGFDGVLGSGSDRGLAGARSSGVLARRSGARARRTEYDGVPKQSKSIDAGISLAEDPAAVREHVASAPDSADPQRSPVFQAMCLASRYDADRLDELAAACESGGEAWAAARRAYAEYVAGLAGRWRATAE